MKANSAKARTSSSANEGQPARAVRLSDIAEKLGIAVSTVSMAIADDPRIAESTRKIVKAKADELGFRPNPSARRLLKGFTPGEIAIMMHDIDQGILTAIAREIRFGLAEQGFQPSIHIADSPGGGTEGQAHAIRRLRDERPEAIICFLHDVAEDSLEELRRYSAEGGTLASYFNPLPLECDQTIFDEAHGTKLAVRRLAELGHTQIGFCTHGTLDRESYRYVAFVEEMTALGLPVIEEYLMAGGRYEQGGVEIAQKFVALENPPTALHIVNDAQADGFIAELYRMGISVPEYVSVIGTDDIAAGRCNWIPISTVSVPSFEIADSVVEQITSRLRKEYSGPPRTQTVTGALIERSTTSGPRSDSASASLQA